MAESMSAVFPVCWTEGSASDRGPALRRKFRRWCDGSAGLALMASVTAHASVAALFLTDNAITVETGQPIFVEIVAEAALPASDAAKLEATRAAEDGVTGASAQEVSLQSPDTSVVETDVEPRSASVGWQVAPSPSLLSKPASVAQEIAAVPPPTGSLPIPPRRPARPAPHPPNPAFREPIPTERVAAEKVSPPTADPTAATNPGNPRFKPEPQKARASPATQSAALGGQQRKALAASGNPRPPYPARAVRRGLEGRVVLDVEVLVTGRVGEIVVAESSGHGLLDRAAIKGVRKWRFKPARLSGIDMQSRVRVPVRFELER